MKVREKMGKAMWEYPSPKNCKSSGIAGRPRLMIYGEYLNCERKKELKHLWTRSCKESNICKWLCKNLTSQSVQLLPFSIK